MKAWIVKKLFFILMGIPLLDAQMAYGGALIEFGAQWRNHSFAPLEEETTPNYFGVGPYLGLGWSIGNVFDLNLFGQYAPSQLEKVEVGKQSAELLFYGGEIGIRVAHVFFLGLRGGYKSYKLHKQELEEEIPGHWLGPGGEVSLGGVVRLAKRSYLQITFDLGSAQVIDQGAAEMQSVDRRLDWMGVTFALVYVGLDRFRIDNLVLADWLDF